MHVLNPAPNPRSVVIASLARALRAGWAVYLDCLGPSVWFAGIFAVLGVLMAWGLQTVGLALLVLPLAGGFMLVGPALVAGFLGLSAARRAGRKPAASDLWRGMAEAPRGVWVLALFCLFIFLVWLTDASTLYSFMVGERVVGLAGIFPASQASWRFHMGAAVTGGVLALLVFVVTVHGVPLQLPGGLGLAGAITASVRACFKSPLTHALWGLILTGGVALGLLVPPLLVLVLPVLAFSGEAFHREVFGTQ